jgi:peptidoglycan/LPS O-acetylase OafA/YrhL
MQIPPFRLETDNSYRDDIQGIRALGAIMIAVYHIWIAKVSGGVDIFFVISGFLMASVLARQFERQGKVQPLLFWGNLAKRISPSAYVVLLATLVLGYFFIPEALWMQLIKETIHSAFHVQNIGLMRDAVDYLARDNPPSPVQQFWALSIQMQFYVLLPFLLMAGFWLSSRLRSVWPTVAILATVIVASFVYSVLATRANPAPAYFNPLTRAWEFYSGSLLVFLLPYIRLGVLARNLMGLVGLAILLVGGSLVPASVKFPGYVAALPVAAALLLIISGARGQDSIAKRVLSHRYLVAIGGVSFTIYLWHWPLLVFGLEYTKAGHLNLAQGLLVILLAVILAFATTRLVERPLREKRIERGGVLAPYFIGMAFLLPVLGSALLWKHHLQSVIDQEIAISQRFEAAGPSLAELQDDASRISEEHLIAVKSILPDAYADNCHQDGVSPEVKDCAYGDVTSAQVVALVGGSHSAQWLPALNIIGKQSGLRIVNITKSDCPLGALEGSHPSCIEWNRQVVERLKQLKPIAVVTTSTRASKSDGSEYVPEAYVRQWKALDALGIDVIAIRDNPSFAFDVITCVSRNKDDALACSKPRSQSLSALDPAVPYTHSLDNLSVVDMSEFFCTAETCVTVSHDYLMYRDWQHLNVPFVVSLTTKLNEKLAAASPRLFQQASFATGKVVTQRPAAPSVSPTGNDGGI